MDIRAELPPATAVIVGLPRVMAGPATVDRAVRLALAVAAPRVAAEDTIRRPAAVVDIHPAAVAVDTLAVAAILPAAEVIPAVGIAKKLGDAKSLREAAT